MWSTFTTMGLDAPYVQARTNVVSSGLTEAAVQYANGHVEFKHSHR